MPPAKAQFVVGMDWARTITKLARVRERSKIRPLTNRLVVSLCNELYVSAVGQYSPTFTFDPAYL
ncbi:hypothetical protein M404DRAFT_996438 [Pisolithus tinctorius Marx 270]|uniref:Uncharacterized protein n=1 Tax=Pisolithus tinctorius Marx 270 TaxID=870435 RepID=A0A0C3P823_PISTI|nr:hypothetical protein M404DRAFT_996438 [Pisolithus tinctorius Marx 270]